MCDIRAFRKEIMDLPEDSDIYEVPQESSSESGYESAPKSPCSTTTFNVPDFESEFEFDVNCFETDEPVFAKSDNE